MRSIPAEIVARWGPMWPKGHMGVRGWWTQEGLRADGASIGLLVANEAARAFSLAPLYRSMTDTEVFDAMAAYDIAHPLPAPEPQVGQVWVTVGVEWTDYPVTYVDDHEMVVSRIRWTGNKKKKKRLRYVWFSHVRDSQVVWPPPDAFLVAGPTPWGRDIPWSPP